MHVVVVVMLVVGDGVEVLVNDSVCVVGGRKSHVLGGLHGLEGLEIEGFREEVKVNKGGVIRWWVGLPEGKSRGGSRGRRMEGEFRAGTRAEVPLLGALRIHDGGVGHHFQIGLFSGSIGASVKVRKSDAGPRVAQLLPGKEGKAGDGVGHGLQGRHHLLGVKGGGLLDHLGLLLELRVGHNIP